MIWYTILYLIIVFTYAIPTVICYFITRRTFKAFNLIYPYLEDESLRNEEFACFKDQDKLDYVYVKNLVILRLDSSVADVANFLEKKISDNLKLLELVPIWNYSIRENYDELLDMRDELEPFIENKQSFFGIVL